MLAVAARDDRARSWPGPSVPSTISSTRFGGLADGKVMAPLFDLADFPEPDDDTERFSVQTCPCCAARTAVPLCLPFSACEVCGERIAVAPLPRVTAS